MENCSINSQLEAEQTKYYQTLNRDLTKTENLPHTDINKSLWLSR